MWRALLLSVGLTSAFNKGVQAGDFPIWENSVWQVAGRYAGVKPEVIYSIALRESGMRWNDGKVRPWPWTVNSPRGPMRLRNKASAYSAIQKLQDAGYTNIDAGWMQINLGQHPGLVHGVDYLDPKTNVILGGVILREAMDASKGSVMLAAGRYHSWNRQEGEGYAKGVARTHDEVVRLLRLNSITVIQ